MPYLVDRVQGSGQPSYDAFAGELSPVRFMVQNVPFGADPTNDPQLPIIGAAITVGSRTYRCDRIQVVETISDTAHVVEAMYSTDGRFSFPEREEPDERDPNWRSWDLTYQKQQLKIPLFTKGIHEYSDPNGNTLQREWWYKQEETLDLEFSVLNTSVSVPVTSNQGIRDIINLSRSQVGHLHEFLNNTYWVMQAPTIRIAEPVPGHVKISYTWISDPGSGSIGNPDPTKFITPPHRPPWYKYVITPADVNGGQPTISVFDLYPPESGFNTPTGYQGLPGDPI